jgi:hypothetical protein
LALLALFRKIATLRIVRDGKLASAQTAPYLVKAPRIISGCLIFLAVITSWISVFPLWNRLGIYFKRDRLRAETFHVTGAKNRSGREQLRRWWLTGTINGKDETVRPIYPRAVSSAEELLTLYPRGTTLPVLFDPEALDVLIQNESLRVVHFTPDFWSKEARLRYTFLCLVILPVPIAIGIHRAAGVYQQRVIRRRTVESLQRGL